MKIGLQIPQFTWPGGDAAVGETLRRVARAADDAGFASIWLMDHFFQIPQAGAIDEPMLEAYAGLAHIAAVTERAKLGAMVTGAVYRQPAFLVKAVTTLDVLSGGRAILGIGAAWNEHEAKGLGFPFPPVAERFERLEETLQIAKHMWSGDRSPFTGKHYQLDEPISSPQPISKPHPPILIGGGGEKKTLRLVAQYADACNVFAFGDFSVLAHKLDVLRGHCEAIGRDFDEIERTALSVINFKDVDAKDVIESCRTLAGLGVQHFIVSMPNINEMSSIERMGREVIPEVVGM